MTYGDGALIVREKLSTSVESDAVLISGWCTATVNVFLLRNPLEVVTSNAGGAVNEFRGVFQDEIQQLHHETAPNYNGYPLRGSVGGEFIIGADGLNIPGYSDDATITANNVLPTNVDERAAEILRIRKSLTANRVLVSLAPGGDPEDHPVQHNYKVTYLANGDTGVRNLSPGPISYLVVGDMTFVYDEATA